MRLSSLGCCPTVIASHNEKSVVVLHKAHFTFLLPHEHALLQGCGHPRVAPAHNLFCRETSTLGPLLAESFMCKMLET